jgi:MFS family permease
MASFVALLDGSVVNVALPAITRDLGGGLRTQQWTVDAYLVGLGALILIAGSLSDLFGRRRILTAGLLGFLVASILCAIAPNGTFLIASRALQGVAGALLVPSSLALIMSAFRGPEQSRAIGHWTAWTGIAFVICRSRPRCCCSACLRLRMRLLHRPASTSPARCSRRSVWA